MKLSKQSKAIDRMLSKGYRPKEIAEKLGIKPSAVYNRAWYKKRKEKDISLGCDTYQEFLDKKKLLAAQRECNRILTERVKDQELTSRLKTTAENVLAKNELEPLHNRYYTPKEAHTLLMAAQNGDVKVGKENGLGTYITIRGFYEKRTFLEWLTNKPKKLQKFKVLG